MHYTATATGGEDARNRHETQRKSAVAARRSYAARAERRRSVGRSVGRPNERRIQFPYMAFAYGKIGGNGSLARATMCV